MTTSAACSEPRQALVETMRRLAALGLNRGTAGNASVRTADGFLVTAAGRTLRFENPDQMKREEVAAR